MVKRWCNRDGAVSMIMLKIRKHFLKVVQGYSLFLTSTIAILPISIKGLQSLSIYFHRVSVKQKDPSLAIGG